MVSVSPLDIDFSVDLHDAVIKQVLFLKMVDSYPNLYSGPLLKQAIYRYENLWLPLAAKHRDQHLSAPLDIAWVWHCHMLAPLHYANDCMDICGCIVSHSLTSTCDKETTQRYWSREYPSHPYEVDASLDKTYMDVSVFSSKLTYNLEEAASRQKVFYYQVSLSHYRDDKFIKTAVQRYRKFLVLKQSYPDKFIVPCYDVDVVWHAHQIHPVDYKRETECLLGKHFNHDDSVNDRSPGSKLITSDVETRALWRMKFGENFSQFGAMFRGMPTKGKLFKVPYMYEFHNCSRNIAVEIISAEILNAKDVTKLRSLVFRTEYLKRTKTNILLASQEEYSKRAKWTFLKMKDPIEGQWTQQNRRSSDSTWSFEIDVASCGPLQILLYKNGILGSVGPKHLVGKVTLDLAATATKCSALGKLESESTRLNLGNAELQLNFNVKITELGYLEYTVVNGSYVRKIYPPNTFRQEATKDFFRHVPLGSHTPTQDTTIYVANHRIINQDRRDAFNARVIHCPSQLMSVVQIFHLGNLSVVCHLLGSDTIPDSDQVLHKGCVTLNASNGERALIIKNNDGDWAILIGYWTGVRKGVPGIKGTRYSRGIPGTPGNPGHLEIKMFKFSTKTWWTLTLEHLSEEYNYSFTFGQVRINLRDNLLKYKAGSGEIAEHIALAFSVSLLHVLCQPRPRNWKEGESLLPQSPMPGKKVMQHFPTEKLKMLYAMGILLNTPSNYYLRQRYQDNKHVTLVAGVDTSTVSGPPSDVHYGDDVHDDVVGWGDNQNSAWEEAFAGGNIDLGGDDGDGDPCGCGGCGGCGGGDSGGCGGGDSGGDSGGDGGGDGGGCGSCGGCGGCGGD